MNRRYCLTLDLKDDPKLIAEYKKYHEKVWPEITASIKQASVLDMEIYLLGTRMCMTMEVDENFSFEAKQKMDGCGRDIGQVLKNDPGPPIKGHGHDIGDDPFLLVAKEHGLDELQPPHEEDREYREKCITQNDIQEAENLLLMA